LKASFDAELRKRQAEEAVMRKAGVMPWHISEQQKRERHNRVRQLHTAVSQWLDSRLPTTIQALDRAPSSWTEVLQDELRRAGVYRTNEYGWVGRLEVTRRSPSMLVVVAGIHFGCGNDDAVYVFEYPSSASRRLALQSLGDPEYDEWVFDMRWSTRHSSGAQSFLIVRRPIQCQSNWRTHGFYAFHTRGPNMPWTRVLGDHHWIFGDHLGVKITPDELTLEFHIACIDTGILVRPRVLHMTLSQPGVQRRLDPLALQPRDFVDEWLDRPWTELASRTESPVALHKWHKRLSASEGLNGEFALVQQCSARPGLWQIGLTLDRHPGVTHYFLVRDLGEHRYRMVDISTTRQPGCPGEGIPRETETPTLFPARPR
jgi:hypothetical protein